MQVSTQQCIAFTAPFMIRQRRQPSSGGFCRQVDRHALARGVHAQFRLALGHESARVPDQAVNPFVVVVRVVVEQGKLFDAGLQRERDGIVHTTMPPAEVLQVFLGIVLRVENQQIRVAHKIDHFPVLAAGARFGVGEKGDQAVGRKQPVADTNARMISAQRAHAHRADVEVEVLEFLDFDVAGQLVERHGEIGAFHLAGQGIDQTLARAFATQNPEPAV